MTTTHHSTSLKYLRGLEDENVLRHHSGGLDIEVGPVLRLLLLLLLLLLPFLFVFDQVQFLQGVALKDLSRLAVDQMQTALVHAYVDAKVTGDWLEERKRGVA